MTDWRKAQADVHFTIWGDRWWYAGALVGLYHASGKRLMAIPAGENFSISKRTDQPYEPSQPLGDITLVGSEGYTDVYITLAAPEAEHIWREEIIPFLRNMAAIARQGRRETIGTTPDELIEYYYRSRAAGGKVTLKQLAEDAGMGYGVLRKRKMEYDARGGWGSKRNKTVTGDG